MSRETWRTVAGFCLLIPGFLMILLLPELGVPLALFGTRLLGHRYGWAKSLNTKIDRTWAKLRLWFKRNRAK